MFWLRDTTGMSVYWCDTGWVKEGVSVRTLYPDKLIHMKPVTGVELGAWMEVCGNVGLSRKHLVSRVKTSGPSRISGDDLKRRRSARLQWRSRKSRLLFLKNRLQAVQRTWFTDRAWPQTIHRPAPKHPPRRLRGPTGAARPERRTGQRVAGAHHRAGEARGPEKTAWPQAQGRSMTASFVACVNESVDKARRVVFSS